MRLALHGPMFSGKSSLAQELEYLGFTWLNYTDHGKKHVARAMTALLGREVTPKDVSNNKNEWRDFIIQALRVYGFDQGADIEDLVSKLEPDEDIVFDNVRYLRQWEILKKHGFTLVRLTIPQPVQDIRALQKGLPLKELVRLRSESSETPLPYQDGEIVVNTDGMSPAVCAGYVMGRWAGVTIAKAEAAAGL